MNSPESPKAGPRPLPILIVEDDAALREALVDTLGLAGYQVVEAADGSAALVQLERHRVGMVVSDVQMKPMDGHQLLLEVKQRILKTQLSDISALALRIAHTRDPERIRRLVEKLNA